MLNCSRASQSRPEREKKGEKRKNKICLFLLKNAGGRNHPLQEAPSGSV
jgi:hypothetical protein